MSWDDARVRQALKKVVEPSSGRSVADLGWLKSVTSRPDGALEIHLAAEALSVAARAALSAEVEAAVGALPGVTGAHVSFANVEAQVSDTKSAQAAPPPAPPKAARAAVHKHEASQFQSIRPKGIARILAVASGKGGVGKSTVAVGLACAMARLGKRVGLLDADVYGPSTPTMLGVSGALAEVGPTEKIAPIEAHGVKAMSMGFIVPPDKAMVWRGPMVMNALVQLFVSVDWGELDVLVLDLPPGTGDVQLTIAQQVALDGAIIVSTPQEVALADVRRGAEMFQRTKIPVLGIVENMSYLPDEATGRMIDLFGRGGAQKAAIDLNVPFLGELPFLPALRQAGDSGEPLKGDVEAAMFKSLAQRVLAAMGGA
jgi:ATP-binding protein involved in chromosome partitioning